MEPKGYELLKKETEINLLEKELTSMFEDFKKNETKDESVFENTAFKKLQKMNTCCLKLLDAYRDYILKLKNNL